MVKRASEEARLEKELQFVWPATEELNRGPNKANNREDPTDDIGKRADSIFQAIKCVRVIDANVIQKVRQITQGCLS
jgi:hypothetical protein